ncbi:alpha/beta hydrolase [Celeribacter sp.]|uniref:alpha/beta hydrolase n=1 Tax=Celeribacter sp. TaxID=1890673 RepID=UPI003A920799
MDRRAFIATSAAALATGCSVPRLYSDTDGTAASEVQRRVFVATNRHVSPDPLLQYESERTTNVSYLDYSISIPPDRKPGEFSFPRKPLDAQKQFFVTRTKRFDAPAEFARSVAQNDDAGLGTVLFVHGFNVSYPGAVFRAAQIATDFGFKNPVTLFSWPSAGKLARYAYDRDSVLYARAALAETIQLLARTTGKVTILAHSMGGLLTMEALKRLALQEDTATLKAVNGVILVQPDIDLDVFVEQMNDLRNYQLGVAVIGSRRDRALKFSSVITGGHPRAGDASSVEAIRKAGAVLIDVSGAPMGDVLGHDTFMSSPELLAIIKSGELAEMVVAGAPGQDILVDSLALTSTAALAIAYLPYTVTGI